MPNLRNALTSSLDKETTSFRSRLERAEATLQTASTPPNMETKNTNGDELEASIKPNTVVRDSFTMPEEDYALIAQVRQRSLQCGVATTKAEILRAGLQLLHGLKDDELLNAITSLKKVKTGRPNVSKS